MRETGENIPTSPPFYFSTLVCDYHTLAVEAKHIPLRLRPDAAKWRKSPAQQERLFGDDGVEEIPVANLSPQALAYLAALGIGGVDVDPLASEAIWMHALAVGYSPCYLVENADGLFQEWPRVPLPATQQALFASASLGQQVGRLLDTEQMVSNVTTGSIRSELKTIGIIARVGGGILRTEDSELALTAGWGYAGREGVTMPGPGKVVRRDYTPEERACIEQGATQLGLTAAQAYELLGGSTLDIYLNKAVYWKNIPIGVWAYTIGGYQVIKKWLSYRELELLHRPLTAEEVREVRDMARRIAALLLLTPRLDANYRAVKEQVYPWVSDPA